MSASAARSWASWAPRWAYCRLRAWDWGCRWEWEWEWEVVEEEEEEAEGAGKKVLGREEWDIFFLCGLDMWLIGLIFLNYIY